MTKEERAEKIRLRTVEKQRAAAEFPGVIFGFEYPGRCPNNSNFTQIYIENGEETYISLRRSKNSQWPEEPNFPNCERISIGLNENLPGLVALIRALVVRYNAIAKAANSEVLKIPRMEPLEIMDIAESHPIHDAPPA